MGFHLDNKEIDCHNSRTASWDRCGEGEAALESDYSGERASDRRRDTERGHRRAASFSFFRGVGRRFRRRVDSRFGSLREGGIEEVSGSGREVPTDGSSSKVEFTPASSADSVRSSTAQELVNQGDVSGCAVDWVRVAKIFSCDGKTADA